MTSYRERALEYDRFLHAKLTFPSFCHQLTEWGELPIIFGALDVTAHRLYMSLHSPFGESTALDMGNRSAHLDSASSADMWSVGRSSVSRASSVKWSQVLPSAASISAISSSNGYRQMEELWRLHIGTL